MKLLTASLFSVALCTGAWAQTPETPKAKNTAQAQSQVKPKDMPADTVKDDADKSAEKSVETIEKLTNEADAAKPATTEAAPAGLETLAKRAGYAFGLNIGTNIKAQQIEIDVDAMTRGLKDGIEGGKPLMDEQAVQAAMMELQQFVQGKQMERARVEGGKNKTEGEAFLAKNKTAEGVITTASGLQYKVLEAGKGESPKATDVVTVHYVGKLLDGTEFDSSYKRNQPATFPVNGVIAGWTEALQLMKPGAKYRLFIPSDLAYGEQGVGESIGPNAVLIFEVELVSAKPASASETEAGHEGHNHAPGEGH